MPEFNQLLRSSAFVWFRRALLAMLAATVLVGCGVFQRDEPAYLDSKELPALEAPPGLSQPETDPVFEIAGYSLPSLAAQGDESLPPRVPTSEEAEQSRSRVRFGPTGLYLEVDDEAAAVWRRLGFALDRGDMSIDQVSVEDRQFSVRFSHEPILASERSWFTKIFLFWKSEEWIDYSGTYLFEVQRETGATTRVAVFSLEGSVLPMQQAEFVLNRLRQRLG